jgi:exosome complex exonuclease RRP6
VLADKKYQLADWRQRPIPDEMLRYAREDTHYLLYIYDVMIQELVEKGMRANSQNPHQYLIQVLHKSTALCFKTYEKPVVKDYNYYMIIGRNKTLQSLAQFQTLKTLLKWRDYIARIEDESVGYVMPNHVLF